MKTTLHVGGQLQPVEIPFGRPIACRPFERSGRVENLHQSVRYALENPCGDVDKSALGANAKVVIICDDYTRPTPCAEILPAVLEHLFEHGVQEENISILIGAGFHREMTQEEKVAKLGADICRRFPIYHHDALDQSQLCHLGYTKAGVPMIVNRRAVQADFLIGIGVVEIHPWAGFAGGAKILCPGVAGKETINHTHAMPVTHENVDIGVTKTNPFWEAINEVAAAAGLNMVVNVVLNEDEDVCCVKAGAPAQAQAACIQEFNRFNERVFPERADIVITTADPKFQYYGQSTIACFGASRVVKPGGTRIVIAACPEGFGDSQQEIIFYFDSLVRKWSDLDAYWREKRGEGCDNSRNANAVHRHLKLLQSSGLIMVTQGFPSSTPALASLHTVPTLAQALEIARSRHGDDASVITYDRGAMVLPSVSSSL